MKTETTLYHEETNTQAVILYNDRTDQEVVTLETPHARRASDQWGGVPVFLRKQAD